MTPEAIAAILAEFRGWLEQVADAGMEAPPSSPPSEGGARGASASIDLHTLVSQFLALRHEVNLQTRAVRAQQEQNGKTLDQLQQAVEALAKAQPEGKSREQHEQAEHLRPLLKTLVDLADTFQLSRKQLLRSQQALAETLQQLATTSLPARTPELPRLAQLAVGLLRRLHGLETQRRQPGAAKAERSQPAQESCERVRHMLDALVTGYTMSLRRLERALQQHGLEPIAGVGRPFDPELMEVVDLVADSGRPAGEVVEDIRPGYLWHGRVFRYAQVRVAKES